MPNWTINDVTFTGDEDAIRDIERAFQADDPFSVLRPCPQDLLNTQAAYYPEGDPRRAEIEAKEAANIEAWGHANWYHWCIANWGTKWNPSDILINQNVRRRDDGRYEFHVRFDTAWSPPATLLRYLTRTYTGLVVNGWYSLEEECHDSAYNFECFYGNWFDRGVDRLSADDDDDANWDDDTPDDSPDVSSFRATLGSEAKLPLP